MGPFDCAPRTLAACQAVLRRLTEDDLARPSPCTEYTVGEVGQHLVRSMVLLASVAGERLGSPAAGPLEGQVTATAEAALAAWRGRGLGGSVAVGRSTLPASLAVEIIPLELLVHGWDLARATGQPYDPEPAVLEAAQSFLAMFASPDTPAGPDVPFGPSQTVPGDAPLLHQVVALAGRDPGWAPR